MIKILFSCFFQFLFFLLVIPLISQNTSLSKNGPLQTLETHHLNSKEALKAVSTPISEGRKEHQLYVNTSWANCIILKHDGSMHSCNGRYSVLDNGIEIQIEGKSRVIRPGRIAGAIVDGKFFESISSQRFEDQSKAVFFEVLSHGSVNLYVSHILRSRMQGSNALTLDVTGEKVYYMKEDYVFSINKGIIKNIPSKKDFIKSLKEGQLIGEEELKQIKWKKGSKEDLKVAFDLVNELNG